MVSTLYIYIIRDVMIHPQCDTIHEIIYNSLKDSFYDCLIEKASEPFSKTNELS